MLPRMDTESVWLPIARLDDVRRTSVITIVYDTIIKSFDNEVLTRKLTRVSSSASGI